MREHPEVNAPICADQFPVRDSLIKGDTITTTDTLEVFDIRTDTVRSLDTITITRYKTNTVTNTRTIRDTIIRENTARVAAQAGIINEKDATINKRDLRITELTASLDDMQGKRNKWRLWFWIALGAIGAYTFLKIRKLIPF